MNKQVKTRKEPPEATDRIGFFGKIPSHGDFISDSIDRDLLGRFDGWLRAGLHVSQDALAREWPAHYAAAPPIRFIIERNILGQATYIGVMLPSRDRVGREYPLIILAQLGHFTDHPRQLYKDDTWFMAVEALAESTAKAEVDVAQLKAAVQRLRLPRAIGADSREPEPRQRPMTSLWWYLDQDSYRSKGMKIDSKLAPEDFLRIYRDLVHVAQTKTVPAAKAVRSEEQIAESNGREDALTFRPEAQSQELRLECSYATHSGTSQIQNTDAIFIDRQRSTFAIADGHGPLEEAAESAKRTANALAALGSASHPSEVLPRLTLQLELLNADLHARQTAQNVFVSLIIAHIDGRRLNLLWSGDSRSYLLRDGTMQQISRDHLAVGMTKKFSKAVGLLPSYEHEIITLDLQEGDRLLLCNQGLVSTLGERAIATIINETKMGDSANALVQNALIENAKSSISAIIIGPPSTRDRP